MALGKYLFEVIHDELIVRMMQNTQLTKVRDHFKIDFPD